LTVRTSILLFLAAIPWVAAIPEPDATIALTSAPPYSATGELYVSKADTNAPGLHNPVLVVEGFDLDNSMDWPELYDLLNQENLLVDMQAYGRDLLILNFGDSTIDILANAALTESAIGYINANRADPSDKFTAVGASLGGLAVRKALVDMPNHGVDTWVSFDAPHEGANIPLGVQKYLEFFAEYEPAADNLLAALDQPASRQLLLVHHSHPNGLAGGSVPERADFQALLETVGYPANCKTIAISNGSGFGEKYPFAPEDHIIHWTGESGVFDVNADIYALPQTSATVFRGAIKLSIFTIDSTTVNAYNPLSFDNAPGGGRTTFLQLYTNIPPDQISGDDYCSQTNHCFVPTVSALGIPIGNLESNLASHAELAALSPFDEIHYAVNNEPHVQINARNKRWLVRAFLEGRDTDGDGYDDYQEYLLGTAYDVADSLLEVLAVIEVFLVDGTAVLSWNAFPNTQYEVWYSAALGDPWQLLETVLPTVEASIAREYLIDTAAPSGFFKIVAAPVDPVSD